MAIGDWRVSNAARAVFWALVLLGVVAPAWGSQVEEMSVRRLADLAAQVVVGQVSAVHSSWAENPRRIETEITLAQVEYAKGGHAGAGQTFSLVVPGGTVGDWTLRVSGAPEFAVGEKWMLFVLPTYKTHPVVGVYRGAFRVEVDAAGVERVYDAERQAVQGIDARGMIVSAEGERHDLDLAGRHSVDKLLSERPAGKPVPQRAVNEPVSQGLAMALTEFRSIIQPVLDQSRDYQLSGPAGKREAIGYMPVAVTTHGEASLPLAPERGAGSAVPKREVERSSKSVVKREGPR